MVSAAIVRSTRLTVGSASGVELPLSQENSRTIAASPHIVTRDGCLIVFPSTAILYPWQEERKSNIRLFLATFLYRMTDSVARMASSAKFSNVKTMR